MPFIARLILSIMTFALGILCMKYSVAITDQFSGKIDMAEKYLGGGIGAGTYTFWKIFGLGLCVISILWLFNKLPGSGSAVPNTAPTSMLRSVVKS
jgi:hypothetical protein